MRKLSIVLILLCLPILGQSQKTIAGKVVDELGLPVYRAAVAIIGTSDVVYTDFDGNFTLESEKDFHWKITIQSTGYTTESFFVLSGGSTGNLTLSYDAAMKELLSGEADTKDDS